jgi:hypothetical protein
MTIHALGAKLFHADVQRDIIKLTVVFYNVVNTPKSNVSTVINHYIKFSIPSHLHTQLSHLQSNTRQDMFDCENYMQADW